jgi:hypothetical protein
MRMAATVSAVYVYKYCNECGARTDCRRVREVNFFPEHGWRYTDKVIDGGGSRGYIPGGRGVGYVAAWRHEN